MVEIKGLQAFCKEVHEICHADVSWLLIYLIFWHNFDYEMGQIWGFQTFFFENSRYEEFWSLACWCILIIFKIILILVTVDFPNFGTIFKWVMCL